MRQSKKIQRNKEMKKVIKLVKSPTRLIVCTSLLGSKNTPIAPNRGNKVIKGNRLELQKKELNIINFLI